MSQIGNQILRVQSSGKANAVIVRLGELPSVGVIHAPMQGKVVLSLFCSTKHVDLKDLVRVYYYHNGIS